MDRGRAIIVGAGIGGLSAAIALRRVGFEVVVLERAEELRAAGAGIVLWPNALLALRALGLGPAVEDAGAVVDHAALRSSDGRVLSPSVAAELRARYGAPLVGIHRAALQATLLDAVRPTEVRLGSDVVGIEGPADVRLRSGELLRGDLVVGADGLRSRVRGAVLARDDLRFAGYVAWRGVVAADAALSARLTFGETWGQGMIFGLMPIGGSQVCWWASARADRKDHRDPERQKAALLRDFGGWHGAIAEIVDATVPAAIIRTPLFDRPPLRSFSRGRVALLGDAAHPMLPHLGQGAGQAIEDAVALASALATDADAGSALADYSARRARRAALLVRRSRQMARVAQLANPLGVRLRNAAMRPTTPAAALKRLEPILAG